MFPKNISGPSFPLTILYTFFFMSVKHCNDKFSRRLVQLLKLSQAQLFGHRSPHCAATAHHALSQCQI